eukprot:PITA_10716
MLNRDIEAFKYFIKLAKLVDIFPKSGTFTWNNKRRGDRQIASKLDKFLMIETILMEGITVDSDILPSGGSDHWPIIMNAAIQGTPRNKPFKFEKFCNSHPKFTSKIEQWWSELLDIRGTKMFILQAKLKHIKTRLKTWNQEVFGDIFKEKKKLEEQMEQIHKEWIQGNINQETMNTEQKLISAIDHRSANKILRIEDEQGTLVQTHHEISSLLINHFIQIARDPNIDREEYIKDLLTSIPKLITEDQNKALNRAITLEEVEKAVKYMPNGKAPRFYGFTIDVYKSCWEIIKTEVWEVVEDSQRSSSILKSLNSTFITLIIKEEEANTPSKFQPIALCKLFYKIISKVIANRIKPILPGIILEEQYGYVEGRQIMDNILVAQEMIHTLQTQKKRAC